jgi:hypothetical protein
MAGHTGRANLRPRGHGPWSARRPDKDCRAASGARAKERPCAPGRLGLGKITARLLLAEVAPTAPRATAASRRADRRHCGWVIAGLADRHMPGGRLRSFEDRGPQPAHPSRQPPAPSESDDKPTRSGGPVFGPSTGSGASAPDTVGTSKEPQPLVTCPSHTQQRGEKQKAPAGRKPTGAEQSGTVAS